MASSFWARYKQHIGSVVLNDEHDDAGKVSYWRNIVFCNILTYLTPLSVIALIPGVYMAFSHGVPVVGFADLFAFFLIVIVAVVRGIKLEVRKSIYIFILYCLAVTLLYYLPIPGPGLLFLLALTIFSSLIYSSSAAYYSALINTLLCGCFALLIYLRADIPGTGGYNLGTWIAISSNLVFLSFACAKCLDLLLAGLVNSLNNNKAAEEKLTKTNRLYAYISAINQMIVKTKDETVLYNEACRIAVDIGKYKMAWIGTIDEATKMIVPLVHAGEEDGYLTRIKAISIDDIPEGRGPTGTALRQGKYIVCNDIESDIKMAPWWEDAASVGYRSSMALPIKMFGKVVASYSLYSASKNFFDEVEIAMAEEAARDICFALENIEKEGRHKLAEEIIEKNEKRFRALIEQSADMETLASVDGKLFYASPSITKVLGYPLDEFLNTPAKDMIHPDDIGSVFENVQKISQIEGGSIYSQHRLKHKNGSYLWCEGSFTNMLHEPAVNAMVSNFRDISERKKAELAIIESEEIFRRLFDESADATLLLNDTGFTRCNLSAATILGYKNKEEIIGKQPWDISPEKQPDDQLSKAKTRTMMAKARQEGYNRFDWVHIRSDGSELHVEVMLTSITLNEVQTYYTVWRDITERKQSEQKILESEKEIRSLADSMPQIVWVTDGRGHNTYFNQQWVDYTGLTLAESSGEGWLIPFHEEDKLRAWQAWNSAVQRLGEYSVECRLRKSDGSYHWWLIRGVPKINESGEIVKWYGTCTDIEKIKEKEAEQVKITQELIQRNRNLEQFSYIVSHNLRAPVVNILGLSELMKFRSTDANLVQDAMKGMAAAAQNLDNVIRDMNDILQISKLISESKEDVYFQNLVDDIALSIDHLIKKENVIIRTDFESIDKLNTVKGYLYSIFYNLILNSIKFRRDDVHPLIEVRSQLIPGGVQLVFKDNGMGIDLKKNRQNLFGLYKRFHPQIEGKGMGMFMVKTQVETLGGKISVISEVNNGTEFTIEFGNHSI